jgi:hypothetical protein
MVIVLRISVLFVFSEHCSGFNFFKILCSVSLSKRIVKQSKATKQACDALHELSCLANGLRLLFSAG